MMSDMQTIEPQSLFAVGQIKLAQLSVYNWGSFEGLHTASFDAFGTLVTGDNGAGKSTLIDGLMALLLPAGKATFNVAAAQGDRADRTLISYIRGSFGSAHDGSSTRVKSKREGAVVTALRALYQGSDGSQITLLGVFWTTVPGNSLADVKRVYAVAKKDIGLPAVLGAFGEGNARTLKQWLKADPAISGCDENFAEYQECYRRALYMENKNAPALLSRALGLKKIDDLTGLIRELVLEAGTVKEDVRKVVDEFADLVAIHQQLTDARARRDHLAKLPALAEVLQQASAAIDTLVSERDGLSAYFGEQCYRLWQSKIEQLQQLLNGLELELKQLSAEEEEASQTVEQRHGAYLQAGGEQIERVRRDLQHAQALLAAVIQKSSRYQRDVKALGLDGLLEESQFIENQQQADKKLQNIDGEKKTAQDNFAEHSGFYGQIQQRQLSTKQDIAEIEARPDSNIDVKYQKLRDEMVAALDLAREQCMFIGELVDVKPEQISWQGAIERALGGLRTTLAVPSEAFSMVTRWLNQRHTGLHVRVQVVTDDDSRKMAEFKTEGYLKKLLWREHPYRDWLKKHLARFDLQCVSSTEELDVTPFSMTQAGLMHMQKGRFDKKDQHRVDDRRVWQLGFSNKSRLALLRQDLHTLASELVSAAKKLNDARAALDEVGKRAALWQKLTEYQWDDIKAPFWQDKVTRLKQDLALMEQSGNDLQQAKQRWLEAKEALAELRDLRDILLPKIGAKTDEVKMAQRQMAQARQAADEGLADAVRKALHQRIGLIQAKALERVVQLQTRYRNDIDKSKEQWSKKRQGAVSEGVGIMSSFRSKWVILAADWGSDVASLSDYLEHLSELEQEGLPALVEQFQQRLNKNATQSIARIRSKMDSEREEITDRIDTINQVLRRTEFRPGSHLKLGAKSEQYPHVKEFNKQLNTVLSQATSEDSEARFSQLKVVVEILEKASNPTTSSTLESLRLLDPRHQLSFYAEELDSKTSEIRDVLMSSSGKSGGEKESFAGTIVAASLAYVLTPDGADKPVYCTVFLDEAFSNTAESVSRRVLRVFRELNIHVNLITPYKNLNLARESARSLLIAERDSQNHESHLCEVSWQEIDRRLEQSRQRKLVAEAEDLGVEILAE